MIKFNEIERKMKILLFKTLKIFLKIRFVNAIVLFKFNE